MSAETTAPTAARPGVCIIGDAGGAHVRSRVQAIAATGTSVHILTPRPSGLGLPETIIAGNSERDLAAAWRRAIRAAPGDIVHIHYASSWGAWLFALSGDPRPLVVTVMGGDVLFDEQSNPNGLARWLVRLVLRRADTVTAKARELADALSALGVEDARVARIVWGTDTGRFCPGDKSEARVRLGLPADGPMVFSPRMLKPFYRTDVIVDAFRTVHATHPDARLVIAEYDADPAFADRLRAMAAQSGLGDSVIFAGVIGHERMADYYRAADAVVGLPPSDGFPQTVFEAMACGAVNIVTDLDRYREFLSPDETAVFVEPTAPALASALDRVLGDGAFQAALVKNGLARMRELPSLADQAEAVAGIYARLAADRPARRLGLLTRLAGRAVFEGMLARNALRGGRG